MSRNGLVCVTLEGILVVGKGGVWNVLHEVLNSGVPMVEESLKGWGTLKPAGVDMANEEAEH